MLPLAFDSTTAHPVSLCGAATLNRQSQGMNLRVSKERWSSFQNAPEIGEPSVFAVKNAQRAARRARLQWRE
jgi:hypothetical protein